MMWFSIAALLAGGIIAFQAALNAQLGTLLHSPMQATAVVFAAGCIFSVVALTLVGQQYPDWTMVRKVPWYLWFSGGALSALAIGLFYFLIPRMGVGNMMSFALTGQLLIAVVLSHLGWFQLPAKPVNLTTIVGVCTLILGAVLINLPASTD